MHPILYGRYLLVFIQNSVYWHIISFFVLMANASLPISSISTVASIFAAFYPNVAWEDTTAPRCSSLFEQLPTGRGVTQLPAARALLGASSVTATISSVKKEKGQWRGMRQEKWEKVGCCQSKRVTEKPERTLGERKRESWPKESSLVFTLFLVLSTGAVLPFPPLLPHVPSCCHPGLPSHPACGPAVLFLSHDKSLSEPRKAHFIHLDGIRQNLEGVKLVSTPTVYMSSDHHTYGLRVFVRKVTMWLESMSVNVS